MTALLSIVNILLGLSILVIGSNVHAHFTPGPYKDAHATFYGTPDGTTQMGGACGYSDVQKQGYGTMTAALSTSLFNNGATCGACYQILCDPTGTKFCKRGLNPVFVTATNFCPPNPAQPSNNGGWCNPPREHFDLAMPAFLHMAEYKAGIVPIKYRRVPCKRFGGIQFTIEGNANFYLVSVTNVGGAGDVVGLEVSNNKSSWTKMKRNFGQKWDTNVVLIGHSLSFRVYASDGQLVTLLDVASNNWQFGQTFQGKYNLS